MTSVGTSGVGEGVSGIKYDKEFCSGITYSVVISVACQSMCPKTYMRPDEHRF